MERAACFERVHWAVAVSGWCVGAFMPIECAAFDNQHLLSRWCLGVNKLQVTILTRAVAITGQAIDDVTQTRGEKF